jgi:O-antigen/teichoic acid export membrane protein
MIDTSAQNALKNSVYNLIGFLLPIVVIIFVTPIIIAHWGVKEYGVYIFLNTIITFLGLLDLGVSTANSKHIIEYYSTRQEKKLKDLIYSMNTIYFLMAIVYFLACISIGFIIHAFFIARVGSGNNYLLIFFIVGLTAFVGALFTNFSNILATVQRYDLALKVSMTFMILSNFSMLILVVLGYGLVSVLWAQLALAFLCGLSYFVIARKVFPVMQFNYAWAKAEIVRNYKFGIPVAFNNLANSSLVHFDKLLVPIFAGSAQLTYYSVPGSIATKISSISDTFSSLLFPITVNLHSLNQFEKIKRVYIRAIRLIIILSAALAFSIICMVDKILLYWLNESFVNQSTNVLVLLVLTNFFLALFSPVSYLLTAMGKMKFLTTSSVVMAITNIIALVVLLPRYGITGAAWAYLIATLFVCYMLHYAEKNYFKIEHTREHIKLFLKLVATALPFFLIVKFVLYPFITNLLTVMILGPLSVLLFLVLYKAFGFVETEDWNDFKLFASRALTKFKIKRYLNGAQ